VETELLYLRDQSLQRFSARVVEVGDGAVSLDRTAFYVTGGGQPHDTGTLRWAGGSAAVVDVRRGGGGTAWHRLEGPVPSVGTEVDGALDWERRSALMRTHTALHVLCGVIWNRWETAVTGGDMSPLSARMDFEFDPLPEGFGAEVEALVNAELSADRPVEIGFLPREEALADAALIRTKVNLIPESVREIRVVDIVGLDKQADGGTHVLSTAEVGAVRVVGTESKGKDNKRIRLEVTDPAAAPSEGSPDA
jgi:misacylated tRNA(Ala) deacylase